MPEREQYNPATGQWETVYEGTPEAPSQQIPTSGTNPSAAFDWRTRYPWWHDPDNAPPDWQLQPGQPPIDAAPGYVWGWTGDHWDMFPAGNSGAVSGGASTDRDIIPTTYGTGAFGGGPQLRSLSDLWPGWAPPQFSAPPAFSYPDFKAPTAEDAENEPGYRFAAEQGRKQVEATKAAQGVYRSGQTLKDIYAWASEYAKQNYGGVFDRQLQVYGTNRNNAADTYMTNYGVSRDVFDRSYQSYLGGFNAERQKAELEYKRDWDLYTSYLDTNKFLVQQGRD